MPGIEDWVNNPLDIIQNIFDQHSEADSKVVREYFAARTQSKNALSWIPSLNDGGVHALKPNSLVRYRCMIQDMFDPEFYLGVYEVKDVKTGHTVLKSGKYKDVAECSKHQEINVDSPQNKTMDRQTLYCVPVPGETSWVKEGHADRAGMKVHPSSSRTPVRCKRSLEEDGEEESCLGGGEAMETNEESSDKTTSIESSADNSMETTESKRTKTDESQASNSAALPDLNFPLQNESGISCLVKIYEDLDEFKLNDVVEFIGVLSVDPSLAQFDGDNETENGPQSSVEDLEVSVEERNAHAPPPSLVPRLHAVLARPLPHTNPLLTAISPEEDDFKIALKQLQSEIGRLRQEIIAVLEHVVFGDGLAAEYLLCHLISSVYGRADVMPLGKFCLNLSKIPASSEYGQLLHKFISSIVTKSHLLPVTLDNMNKMKLSPQKDYKANRLISGVLQLSDKTSLIVDETVLEQGQLDVNGVKNMTALGNLISWQKVEYDFCYHKQDFLSNVAVLVLSEAKSFFPSDCFVPLCASPPPGQSLHDYFSKLDSMLHGGLLSKIRLYLTVCKILDYNMEGEIQKTIQDDFVEVRKEDSKKMTIDDFHALLSLVRLLSLSYLETSPTQSLWNKAKAMEKQRKSRLPETNSSTSRILT